MTDLIPAVGGTRLVPAPDPVARDYLLLGLRLDQHRPGLVDAYFGPADLKATCDMEPLRAPARLRDDALALIERLPADVADPDRRAWLRVQAAALAVHARVLAGESIEYEDLVAACFDHRMQRVDGTTFLAAARELDTLLPGSGALDARLQEWDRRLTVAPARAQAVVDQLVASFRARSGGTFDLPAGESVRVSTVRDRPWAGYNWFEGGRRSRVEINLDLPLTIPSLMHTVAHETYPGHHLDMASKEARLVDSGGHTELTMLLNNTPECLIHEGLADLGVDFAIPAADEPGLMLDAIRVAGLPLAADTGSSQAVAEAGLAIRKARAILRGIAGNAALLRHSDGESHESVARYLIDVGHRTEAQAEQQLEFIEHPIWRTYAFVYREGEQMLRQWLEAVPEPERPARFQRLLAEQRSPSSIRDESSRSVAPGGARSLSSKRGKPSRVPPGSVP